MGKKMSYSKVINNSCLTSRYSYGILMPPPHTKGAVLLACFQCVDTLVFVLKHAEGMSLSCDVICAIAYCGRHESSHIIKVHTDSTRFNKMIICGNLC